MSSQHRKILWNNNILDSRFIIVTLIKLDLMILYKETHQWQKWNESKCDEIIVNASTLQELNKQKMI